MLFGKNCGFNADDFAGEPVTAEDTGRANVGKTIAADDVPRTLLPCVKRRVESTSRDSVEDHFI